MGETGTTAGRIKGLETQSVVIFKNCQFDTLETNRRCNDDVLVKWQIMEAPKMLEKPNCYPLPPVSGGYQNYYLTFTVACSGVPTAEYLKKLGIKK